ncbi:MAG: sigma 54-interacting transcriptional regulator [Deltaproteobacteria bacterium]|nr:sigma 54-interacting transcriptional regulator [Deltaproteobacteria bacterium]
MDSTVSEERVAPQPPPGMHAVLRILVAGGDRDARASMHVVDEVDVVELVRGARDARRDVRDGMRRLVLALPDPMWSRAQGRLLRVRGGWVVDDPRSKNGVTIAGRPTRGAPLRPNELLQVGRTACSIEMVIAAAPALDAIDPPPADERAAIAQTNLPIAIAGETGTGKTTFARDVHRLGERAGRLIAVDATAAARDPALASGAENGTLLIEAIDELAPPDQPALLPVLHAYEHQALVVPTTRAPRLVVTSRNRIADPARAEPLREDVLARVLGFDIVLPPLRARRGELAAQWIANGLEPTTGAVRALLCYDWPRNYRELDHVLATARVRAGSARIDVDHLPPEVAAAGDQGVLRGATRADEATTDSSDRSLRATLAAKLLEHRGNLSAVARDLGEHREQVRRWLRRLELDLAAFRR